MPRYISRSPGFKKVVWRPSEFMDERSVIAHFQRTGANRTDLQAGAERFGLGLADAQRLISVYDTDLEAISNVWDDEKKTKIEKTLDAGQGTDYFRLDTVAAATPKPWPTYDTMDAPTIVEAAHKIGADLDNVIAYERENRNRKSVITALKKTEPVAA